MVTRDEVVAYLRNASERELSEIFRRIPARELMPGVPRHYAIARVESCPKDQFEGDIEVDTVYFTAADQVTTIEFLAYEDREYYGHSPEEMIEGDACEYTRCGCGVDLTCHVKRAACPICGVGVYLT